MAFLTLEKEFNRVPQIFIWWELRKLCYPGTEHQCAKPYICCLWLQPRVYGECWVHYGSVLSPLIFIIMLESLPCVLRSGAPLEDICADNLVINYWIAGGTCQEALDIEKKTRRRRGWGWMHMICSTCLDLLQSSARFLCEVCHTGVGNNRIYCT